MILSHSQCQQLSVQQSPQNIVGHRLELPRDLICVHMDGNPSEHFGSKGGIVSITSRRLFIMAMTFDAPELIIAWAALQFFSARKISKEFNATFGTRDAQTHQLNTRANTTSLSLKSYEMAPVLQAPQVCMSEGRFIHAWTLRLAVTNIQPILSQNGQ